MNKIVSKEEYLEKILNEIERAEKQGKRGVFKIKEKVSDNIAKYVKGYLEKNTNHFVKFERCSSCTKTWDIIIMFRK